jgi:hypothetical protein
MMNDEVWLKAAEVFFARRRRSWLAVLLSHEDFIETRASDCNKKLVVVSLSHEDFIQT